MDALKLHRRQRRIKIVIGHPPAADPLMRIAFLLILPLVAATPLAAQAVRGRVTDARTGQPLAGTIVTLTDVRGARHGALLTRADGAFVLRAQAEGAYVLTAERVGYETASLNAQLPANGTVEQPMELAPRTVQLEPVIARGVRRACTVRPQGGPEAAILWDEARKALAAAQMGRRTYAYQARTVRRELGASGRAARDSTVQVAAGYSAHPFRATPVERLAEHGYVEEEGDSIVFHAPDAGTLLSDVFLDHHCFSIRVGEGAEAGLVGLEFAPLRGRRLPEVRGVLWMDRRTGRLRHVDYAYTNLSWRGETDRLQGRVEFEQLDDGGWIVRRWRVRMPRLVLLADQGVTEVAGFVEHQGEITGIRPAQP